MTSAAVLMRSVGRSTGGSGSITRRAVTTVPRANSVYQGKRAEQLACETAACIRLASNSVSLRDLGLQVNIERPYRHNAGLRRPASGSRSTLKTLQASARRAFRIGSDAPAGQSAARADRRPGARTVAGCRELPTTYQAPRARRAPGAGARPGAPRLRPRPRCRARGTAPSQRGNRRQLVGLRGRRARRGFHVQVELREGHLDTLSHEGLVDVHAELVVQPAPIDRPVGRCRTCATRSPCSVE